MGWDRLTESQPVLRAKPPTPGGEMKVPQAIVEVLKREGVEFLIGYPVNPIIEAAASAVRSKASCCRALVTDCPACRRLDAFAAR